MKTLRKSTLLAAIIIAALTNLNAADATGTVAAPPATTTAETAAIASFKAEIETVGKWIEEKQKSAAADPAAGLAAMGEIIAKVKGVKVDGLPADLKTAWVELGVVLTELGEIFKGIPAPKADKPEETGKAFQEILPKLLALQGKIEPAAQKVQELGTRYGLDLSKVAPSK